MSSIFIKYLLTIEESENKYTKDFEESGKQMSNLQNHIRVIGVPKMNSHEIQKQISIRSVYVSGL